MSSIKKKEEENFKLFEKMILKKSNEPKKSWETWQLRPESNFFMTSPAGRIRRELKNKKSKDLFF